MQNLQQSVRDFGAQLRQQFGNEISLDAAGFKKKVLRLVRQALPPRPGRPNDPQIDSAVRLVQEGKTVKQVLRLQIPGFDKLDTYGRYLAEKGLRAAITRRGKSIKKG